MSSFLSDLSGVQSLTGTLGTTASSGTYSSSASSSLSQTTGLDMTDFLSLMVAQFQNQDPDNAASTTDMLNQMVQMSMIQAITNITYAATMLYTSSLVGKEVTIGQYDSEGKL